MSKPVVVLDPGHGGYDPGAVAYGLKEKDLNLKLALKVAERLEGVKVLLTRERDIFVSLADRVALSRRAEPDLFLSLHANAGGGRGFESFISSSLGPLDPAVDMQRAVHGKIMDVLKRWETVDRGMKRAAFYVLRHNPYPAVLIESLFVDNQREAELWKVPLFVEILADGVANGVQEALGLAGNGHIPLTGECCQDATVPVVPAPRIAPGTTLYTVQVGAFVYINNARQRLAEAQSAGFKDAYISLKQF